MKHAATRLRALLDQHDLPAALEGSFAALLVALTDPHAPTSVREPARAVDVHVADSLSGLAVPQLRAARRIADLGAGAGLPGLVLAAALPAAEVVLIESVARKAAFITAAAAAMGLENARVVTVRAEEWAAGRESCDVVTARALAALPVLCEYAAPLLREGGVLVAWKALVADDERADGVAAAARLGMRHAATIPVRSHPRRTNSTLEVYLKVLPTPAGFPRRAGMAAKRPLRADSKPPPSAQT